MLANLRSAGYVKYMRKLEAAHEFGQLNQYIDAAYRASEPVPFAVRKQSPALHVQSFESLEYYEYGSFLNRLPKITETLALRGLLRQSTFRSSRLYAAADYHTGIYGFRLQEDRLSEILAYCTKAAELGHPETALQVSEQ